MAALLDVILPVFLVIGFGYLSAWRGFITESAVDALARFAQNFAIPCLLFLAISNIDLSHGYDVGLLLSFYIGALAGFCLAFSGARYIFARSMRDSIAIGFSGMFSNSVLLGLPITELAFGVDALAGNYAIISLHAPLIYLFGIFMMETFGRDPDMPKTNAGLQTLKGVFANPIILGISLGFIVNLGQITLPDVAVSGISMIASAGLPTALFSLGGVMFRYRPEGDMRVILWLTLISLIAHPAISYILGTQVFDLDTDQLRSVVVTAAMAPGVNSYLFATMYGSAQRVAASTVLIATALTIVTASVWLAILP